MSSRDRTAERRVSNATGHSEAELVEDMSPLEELGLANLAPHRSGPDANDHTPARSTEYERSRTVLVSLFDAMRQEGWL